MAKGQITEEELSAGLRSVGNLQKLGATGAKRDSPFGLQQTRSDVSTDRQEARAPEKVERVPEVREEKRKPPQPSKTGQSKPVPKPERLSPVLSELEDVTVPLSPSARDSVGKLARDLQRKRTEKRARFTANVVIRVAVDQFLEQFKLKSGDTVNDEAELRELVRRRLGAPDAK